MMTTDFQPYVGPRPYEKEEQVSLFGRDREADELLSLVISNREVLFYAQSGAGKTSLLNAKVIPLLEREGFEVFPLGRLQGTIPEGIQSGEIQNIFIFNVLMKWAGDEIDDPHRLAAMSLADYLKECEHRTDSENEPLPRALILDQFEELFVLYRDRWQDQRDFFKQLADAQREDRLLRLVFSMREEYIAQIDPFAQLLKDKFDTRFRLERLRHDAALAAITGPLQSTQRSFAPGVAELLVNELLKIRVETLTGNTMDVVGEFVDSVQLQVVCRSLWQELSPEVTVITAEHLKQLGSIDRPLRKFYERAIEAATRDTDISEWKLRQWCERWLITSTGTRGMVHRGFYETEGIPNQVLETLESWHLISSEWHAGAHWYELSHDRFVQPIQRSNENWKKGESDKITFWLEHATQLIRLKNYKQAMEYSQEARSHAEKLEDHINVISAIISISKVYELNKQYKEALQLYQESLQIYPYEVSLIERIGYLLYIMKQYEQVLDYFDLYVQLLPEEPYGYIARGYAYVALKRYKQAGTEFQRALELNPKYIDTYNGLGNMYLGLLQYDEALSEYNRALELDPSYVHAYNSRGNVYRARKQYDQALAEYNRALELDPTDIFGYIGRGHVYWYRKQYDQALAEYNRALELNPQYIETYLHRGQVYIARKQYDQALAEYNRALELNPQYIDAYISRGYLHLWQKNIPLARQDFIQSMQEQPSDVNAAWMVSYSDMLMLQQRPGIEMAQRLEDIATLSPSLFNPEAHLCRGVALLLKDNPSEALVELDKAIQLALEAQETPFWKGVACAYLERYEDAVDAIQTSLANDMPPILLSPLKWLEKDVPNFYFQYGQHLLLEHEIDA